MSEAEHNVLGRPLLAVLISFIACFPPASGKNVRIGVHASTTRLILFCLYAYSIQTTAGCWLAMLKVYSQFRTGLTVIYSLISKRAPLRSSIHSFLYIHFPDLFGLNWALALESPSHCITKIVNREFLDCGSTQRKPTHAQSVHLHAVRLNRICQDKIKFMTLFQLKSDF